MSILDSIPDEVKAEMSQFSDDQLNEALKQLGPAEKLAVALFYELLNENLDKLEKIEDTPIKDILTFLIGATSTMMLASILNKSIEKNSFKSLFKTEN